MKAGRVANAIKKGINGLSSVAAVMARVVFFIMMLLVSADVIGRFVFNRSIIGTSEIVELMMVLLVFLALGDCTLQRGHVRVELLVSRFSARTQAILDSITFFASTAIFALIVWQLGMRGWEEVMSSSGRVTLLLAIEEAPFVLIAAFGSLVMCLCLLTHLFQSLAKATIR